MPSVPIFVFVRFRPSQKSDNLLTSTIRHLDIIEGKQAVITTAINNKRIASTYNLDLVLAPDSSQEQMFKVVGEPVVRDVLHGFNGTIFAYGQTGSGKTHTLFGNMENIDSFDRGIIPRACSAIFEQLNNNKNIKEAVIKCSFVEIYNEVVQDLLIGSHHADHHQALQVHENADHSMYIRGVHEEYVTCFKDIYALLQIGFRNRAVASTLMNKTSSRSHCILIMVIKQTFVDGSVKLSKIHFADLAGSERVGKTGATGKVLKEAAKINLSLSALGNCIHALTVKNKSHIPYRDSKLTLLLKDSLGGNTKTSLIVTCSLDIYNIDETITSLKFAVRAKTIKNKAKINKETSAVELQTMLNAYKNKLQSANETIHEMQKLLYLVRSKKWDSKADGSRIDKYLASIDADVDGEEEDEVDDSDDSANNKRRNSSGITPEAVFIIEKLKHTTDHQDKEINELHQEMNKLIHTNTAMEATNELLIKANDKLMEEKSYYECKDTKDEEIATNDDQMLEEIEKVDNLNKKIEFLSLQNEQLSSDFKQILIWNSALQKDLDFVHKSDAKLLHKKSKASDDALFQVSAQEIAKLNICMDAEEMDAMIAHEDDGNLSEHFQHQLQELKLVMDQHRKLEENRMKLKHAEKNDENVINSALLPTIIPKNKNRNYNNASDYGHLRPSEVNKITKLVKPLNKNSDRMKKHLHGNNTYTDEQQHKHQSPGKKQHGFKSGLQNMISYFHGTLIQPSGGAVEILRGHLCMCIKLSEDWNIDEKKDWKRVYSILTKEEFHFYRNLANAEEHKHSLKLHLKDIVRVMKFENRFKHGDVVKGGKDNNGNDVNCTGVFVVSTDSVKLLFKAPGDLSRSVWMESLSLMLRKFNSMSVVNSYS